MLEKTGLKKELGEWFIQDAVKFNAFVNFVRESYGLKLKQIRDCSFVILNEDNEVVFKYETDDMFVIPGKDMEKYITTYLRKIRLKTINF